MTMITPSYLGETIEYSSLHACRSTLEDPTGRWGVTGDGVDADGKPVHSEWKGKFDGKDYEVTGDPNSDMRSYTKVNDQTLNMTVKKGGKVTATGRIAVSADGKSRIVTLNGTTAKGKKFTNTAVYDKG